MNQRKITAKLAFLIYMSVEVFSVPAVYSAPSALIPLKSTPQRQFIQESAPIPHGTYIDAQGSIFATFKEGGTSDIPNVMGRVIWLGREKFLVPTRKILAQDDLYIFKNPIDPLFLEVMEKLPNGGFGRLLRFRGFGPSGQWMDMEYVYQDNRNGLIILDHEAGKFYQTILKDKRPVSRTLFPVHQNDVSKGQATFESSLINFILAQRINMSHFSPLVQRLLSRRNGLSQEEIWSNRLVRGPPPGGFPR